MNSVEDLKLVFKQCFDYFEEVNLGRSTIKRMLFWNALSVHFSNYKPLSKVIQPKRNMNHVNKLASSIFLCPSEDWPSSPVSPCLSLYLALVFPQPATSLSNPLQTFVGTFHSLRFSFSLSIYLSSVSHCASLSSGLGLIGNIVCMSLPPVSRYISVHCIQFLYVTFPFIPIATYLFCMYGVILRNLN